MPEQARTPKRIVNRWHRWGRLRWYLHGSPRVPLRQFKHERSRDGQGHSRWLVVGPLTLATRPRKTAHSDGGPDA